MNDSEKALFATALSEGIINKYNDEMNLYDVQVDCSKHHYKEINKICGYNVNNASSFKKTLVAIILAATLLLAGCVAYVYREEIREFFVETYDAFVKLTFDKKQNDQNEIIEEVYFPSYMLDGFELSNEVSTPIMVLYEFVNDSDELISFEQLVVEGSNFLLDNEKGDTTIIEVDDYKVYHRYTDKQHHYIWNDGKYAMTLNSSFSISNEELKNIIYGMKIKE